MLAAPRRQGYEACKTAYGKINIHRTQLAYFGGRPSTNTLVYTRMRALKAVAAYYSTKLYF